MTQVKRTTELKVSAELSLQIVRDHFSRISPIQWAMLCNGMWDEKTQQILLSMCVQIIHSLSVYVLTHVIQFPEYRRRNMNRLCKIRDETFEVVLTESIGEIFARALNISRTDVDPGYDTLTHLIESEVSRKVNIALCTLLEKRTVEVDSSLTLPTAGRIIINKAKECLTSCLSVPSCSCASSRDCVRSPVEGMDPPTIRKGPCLCSFSMFAQKNFTKMQLNLIESVAEAGSKTPVRSDGTGSIGSSPGGASSSKSMLAGLVDYETIQHDIGELFRELDLAKQAGSAARHFCELSEDRNRFSQRLTDIMYSHLHQMDCFTKPASQMEALVADEVATYLQKLVMFMQRDPEDICEMDQDVFASVSCVSLPVTP